MATGFLLLKAQLTRTEQEEILAAARKIAKEAPLFRPSMPGSDTNFKYSMTNCGDLGWIADRNGYRYQCNHPETGQRFPAMPPIIRELAIALAEEAGSKNFNPESCLINFYRNGEKLGMHRDNTEKNLTAPIISMIL
jgi:alkylated DNA repair protein (DNA oxidative demethylase)